jgi:hypothetical protein
MAHYTPEHQSKASLARWAALSPEQRHEQAMERTKKRHAWLHDFVLTPIQKQIIYGSLMGDMAISYPNSKSNYPRIIIRHSLKQSEYVDWKYSMLKNLCRSPPSPHKNGGYGEMNYTAITRCLPCLQEVFNVVKTDGKIRFTQHWLDLVTEPIGFAVWYMDDGSIEHRGQNINISMGKVSAEEGDLVASWLENRWGLNPTVYHGRKESRIGIYKRHDVSTVRDILMRSGLSLPTMMYKIPYMI